MLNEVYITATNCITPIGFDVSSNIDAIENGISAIELHSDNAYSESPFYGAIISDRKLNDAFSKIGNPTTYTHLEKMMILALHPLIQKADDKRTGFILSTTKGNISLLQESNLPDNVYLNDLAKKVAAFYKLPCKPIVISNACVSGILAVATAKRLIQTRLYDNMYVVAGDEFSKFVYSGFASFQALSDRPCQPYAAERNGLNLGEAAAAIYVTSHPGTIREGDIKIIGDSAINDANHISGPSRTGEGLYRSVMAAINEAKIQASQIDYISAHGTATIYNDDMEAIAFTRAGLENAPVNSFKGIYGHTLGASGLLETVVAIESARKNKLFKSVGYDGSASPINILTENRSASINYFIKTASGFGGCNTAVVFEKQ